MKIKRLTPKIIATGMLVMFLTSLIPNIIWRLFGEGDRVDLPEYVLLPLTALTLTFAFTLFSYLLERLVLRRVRRLNDATKEVMKGNFDTRVEDDKYDEVSQLTHNFNEMIEELQNTEYLNKDFVRNFSHELKTPLSAIKGYAELINSDMLAAEEIKQYSKIIVDESERLSHLSRNMLLISQIDNQVIVPKNDTFNVTELFRNIVQLQQLDWEAKEIEFNLDVDEVEISSNKELLYQVFQNLLSNAIKFSEQKNTIHISLKQKETVEFTISNSGSLTKEEQSKIFDLFYIKDKSRSSKSNGVGLTLTKKIIEKIDGEITVSSQDNLVTFNVKL